VRIGVSAFATLCNERQAISLTPYLSKKRHDPTH